MLSDARVKQMFEAALAKDKESTVDLAADSSCPSTSTIHQSSPNKLDENQLDYVPKLTRAKMKNIMEKINVSIDNRT